jgi:hypothetical protein
LEIKFHETRAEQIYLPRSGKAKELLNDIEGVDSIEELLVLFAEFPSCFGFDFVTFLVTKEGNRRLLKKRVFTTLPKRQHLQLVSNNGNGLQRFLHAASNCEDFLEFKRSKKNVAASLPLSDPSGFGLDSNDGIAFMIEYKSGLTVTVVINVSGTADQGSDLFVKHRADIEGIATLFCDNFIHFSCVGTHSVPRLSNLEIRFLRCVAVKENPDEALKLNYQFGSARNIQTSIVRKLGVNSIHQAVAITMKLGLLDTVFFRDDEIAHTHSELIGLDNSFI